MKVHASCAHADGAHARPLVIMKAERRAVWVCTRKVAAVGRYVHRERHIEATAAAATAWRCAIVAGWCGADDGAGGLVDGKEWHGLHLGELAERWVRAKLARV